MNTKHGGSQKAHIRTPLNKHTQSSDPRTSIYTLNDGEYYTHALIIFHFHFFFIFIFFLLNIYTNGYALNANKQAPKMRSKMDKHTLKC